MSQGAPRTRAARLELISTIIAQEPISSQKELQEALAQRGVKTGQATLSRDLTTLRATKVRTALGVAIYSVPDNEGLHHTEPDPENSRLSRWCQDLLIAADYAQNLLVVRTPIGAANLLGAAIDSSRLPGVVGTIAGDDTILVVCVDSAAANETQELLLRLAAGQETLEEL